MAHIFTYGSLMFHQVWSLVVEGNYGSTEATLKGYDRKGARGEVFPVLFPSSLHSQVHGIVYYDISASDLVRLDDFEGEYFFRTKEQVITEKMGLISAYVYVLKEEYYGIISHQEWNAEHFKTADLHLFIISHTNTDKLH